MLLLKILQVAHRTFVDALSSEAEFIIQYGVGGGLPEVVQACDLSQRANQAAQGDRQAGGKAVGRHIVGQHVQLIADGLIAEEAFGWSGDNPYIELFLLAQQLGALDQGSDFGAIADQDEIRVAALFLLDDVGTFFGCLSSFVAAAIGG